MLIYVSFLSPMPVLWLTFCFSYTPLKCAKVLHPVSVTATVREMNAFVFSPHAKILWEQVPLVSTLHSPKPLLQRGQENRVDFCVLGTEPAVLSYKLGWQSTLPFCVCPFLFAGIFGTAQGTDKIVLHSARDSFCKCVGEGMLYKGMYANSFLSMETRSASLMMTKILQSGTWSHFLYNSFGMHSLSMHSSVLDHLIL